jgi:hypothetical protein
MNSELWLLLMADTMHRSLFWIKFQTKFYSNLDLLLGMVALSTQSYIEIICLFKKLLLALV